MSAFIVEDKTINIIVNFLELESWQKDGLTYGMIDRKLQENGYDLTQTNEDRRLGWDLFKLNCQAVNSRYGDGQAKEFRSLVFKFDPSIQGSRYQVYKSLSCLIYQCSEGDIPERSLYKMLVEIKRLFAECLIDSISEYKQAIWG